MGRMQNNIPSNWNEFQWEREIRRDERRISCYFRELSSCLDLPGEEGMIFDSLARQPGLVPANAAPDHWRMWDELDPDFDEEEEEENDPAKRKRRPGDDLVEQLDKLASEWDVIFAIRLRGSFREEGLAVSCAFGKLLGRVEDFADTDPATMKSLKLSLGKRSLRDLSDLAGMLNAMADLQRSLRAEVAVLIEMLQQIRERMADLLTELRKLTA